MVIIEEELPVTSRLGHLVFMTAPESIGFYRDFFGHLGWKTNYDQDGIFGTTDGNGCDLWFEGLSNGSTNDYDGNGMNHLAIVMGSQADVDASADFLRSKGTELLFGTPCNRPEHAESEDHLYYSVMFTSPDNILMETVYTGPK